MPAVSTKRSGPSSVSTMVSTASRVVPGMSCTIERSSPTRRLNSVDLPTFGRPTIAIEKMPSSVRSSTAPRGSGGQRVDEGVEQVAAPPPVDGRHRVRGAEAEPGEAPRSRSRGARRRPCWPRGAPGCSLRWRMRATCASSSVMPTLTSTTRRITSASATARSACALTWRASGAAPSPEVGQQPAAGVDDGERAAVPVGLEHLAVAGDAGLLLDDRVAAADEPVHQRRLADVRPADDGDHGERRRSSTRTARTSEAPSVATTSTGRGRSAGVLPSRKRPFESTTSGSRKRSPSGSCVEGAGDVGPGEQAGDRDVAAEEPVGDRAARRPACRRPRASSSATAGRARGRRTRR